MSKQVDPRFIDHIDWIEAQLAKPEFVTWDRYVIQDNPWLTDENQFNVKVYGWIDREDAHEDFVLAQFFPEGDRWFGYTTSSDEYTDELGRIWFGVEPDDAENEHAGCRRVEDVFELDNVVEL